MGHAESFRGYAPDLGYEFLRETIAREDYEARGCEISAEEIFISDGAKCDCGNIQEIFDTSRSRVSGLRGLQCHGRKDGRLQCADGSV